MTMAFIDTLKYNEHGLIPAIVQDAENKEVLMLAYMNEEALKKTIETGLTHFWSRSRKKLWQKGESSGHVQRVKAIAIDCDKDTILVKVEQVGPGACHTGHRSCFYQDVEGRETEQEAFSAKDVYK